MAFMRNLSGFTVVFEVFYGCFLAGLMGFFGASWGLFGGEIWDCTTGSRV